MKIQVKTALLFTAVTAGIILFLSLAVYYFASRFTFNDFLKRLELRAKISARIHFEDDETSTAAFNELREQYLTALPKEKVYILEYDSLARKLKTTRVLNCLKPFTIRSYCKMGKQFLQLSSIPNMPASCIGMHTIGNFW
ncbi:hypothetical protein [Paraflavitalea speifideaquila]|uniref:hypothetical protein n=1 Tax=Paraflavitalea speifideaquila TaxID=3076558 RepID=UPI0028E47CD1|nr:hypothetical protein [Paraflavitalea speifideiaquila]